MSVQHILLAVSVPLIWGMGFVFAKGALEYFPPILLMAFRFLVTASVLVWFVKPPVPLMGKIALIALISAAIQYSLTFTGLKDLDASIAVLVVQLEVPFMVLLGAVFLNERPDLQKYLGIVLAFAGVALIAGEPRLEAAYLPLALVVAVMATPQLFVASAIFEDNQLELIRQANWIVWGTVIYLGLIMTAVGYTIWYHLLGKYELRQVGPFLLLLPVFSVIASAIFLGETMTITNCIGGMIVVLGIGAITVEKWPEWLTAKV